MATDREPHRISTPRIYLLRMLVFLALAGFVALILNRQIATAFMANPGLNALIIGVLLIGIVLALRQVWRLFPEVALGQHAAIAATPTRGRQPVLLAPMARAHRRARRQAASRRSRCARSSIPSARASTRRARSRAI